MSKARPRATLTQRHPDDVQVYCSTCSLALWQRASEPVHSGHWGTERCVDCPFAEPCEYRNVRKEAGRL